MAIETDGNKGMVVKQCNPGFIKHHLRPENFMHQEDFLTTIELPQQKRMYSQ
jgi:hypothetical protein